MAREGFHRNSMVHPNGSARPLSSIVWVKCATSAECMFNLSIVVSSVVVTPWINNYN